MSDSNRDPIDSGPTEAESSPDDDLRSGRVADQLDAEALAATERATSDAHDGEPV